MTVPLETRTAVWFFVRDSIYIGDDGNQMQIPVFVDVAERIELPKRRNVEWKTYATCIWLQAFDHYLDFRCHALQLACRSLPIALFIDDRECVVTPRVLSISENQLPDKVIKRRSQIVENLPKSDGPLDGDIGRRVTKYPYLFVSVLADLMDD